jgi:hypothetical protein
VNDNAISNCVIQCMQSWFLVGLWQLSDDSTQIPGCVTLVCRL